MDERCSLALSLILLDLNMPLIDGRKALSKIKSDPLLPGNKINGEKSAANKASAR
jgi:CheY-like chemotaxis protein